MRRSDEFWLNVSTVFVAVGVVLEVFEIVHELREKTGPFRFVRPQMAKWMIWAGFAGWLMIVVGVAGEFVFESAVSTRNEELEGVSNALLSDAQITAGQATKLASDANERAAILEGQAADLAKEAQDERLRSADLEERVAWRTISSKQQKELSAELRGLKGQAVHLMWSTIDPEETYFAPQLAGALRGAGLSVTSQPSAITITGPPNVLDMQLQASRWNPSVVRIARALVCSSITNFPVAVELDDNPEDRTVVITLNPRNPVRNALPAFCRDKVEVRRGRVVRSLVNADGLTTELEQFRGTEYEFAGVYPDRDSVNLLVEIAGALTRAGWREVPSPLSMLNIDIAPVGLSVPPSRRSAVSVAIESAEGPAELKSTPPVLLPSYVRAANALKEAFGAAILPSKGAVAQPTGLMAGNSPVVFIIVGRNP